MKRYHGVDRKHASVKRVIWNLSFKHHRKYFQTPQKNYLSKIITCAFLLYSPVIGLDFKSHSHSREKVQFFEPRLRIIFLALTWRDEIEIIIRPFSYFEKRMRLQIVILVFRDKIETLENHFSWSSEKK